MLPWMENKLNKKSTWLYLLVCESVKLYFTISLKDAKWQDLNWLKIMRDFTFYSLLPIKLRKMKYNGDFLNLIVYIYSL